MTINNTPGIELRSKLTLFDVTNLVVGAIVGADIYVASAFGAGLLGPFSLVVWIAAGMIAIVIALCFARGPCDPYSWLLKSSPCQQSRLCLEAPNSP